MGSNDRVGPAPEGVATGLAVDPSQAEYRGKGLLFQGDGTILVDKRGAMEFNPSGKVVGSWGSR